MAAMRSSQPLLLLLSTGATTPVLLWAAHCSTTENASAKKSTVHIDHRIVAWIDRLITRRVDCRRLFDGAEVMTKEFPVAVLPVLIELVPFCGVLVGVSSVRC